MNLEQAAPKVVPGNFKLKNIGASPNPRIVLKDLFELLEEYGPMWYTVELHDRAKAALSDYQ